MASITHAPRLVTIDGVEYEVAQITLEDLEYLDNWVAGRMLRAARLSVEDDADVTPARRHEVLVSASEAALGASSFTRAGLSVLTSPVGASKFLQRLMRKSHPDITAAQCFRWMMRKDTQDILNDVVLSSFKRAQTGDIASDPTNGGLPSTKVPSSESSSQPESSQSKSAE
jgi:hypothetical protein